MTYNNAVIIGTFQTLLSISPGIISSALWRITYYEDAIIRWRSSTFIDVIKIIRSVSIMFVIFISGSSRGLCGVWSLRGNVLLRLSLIFAGRGSSSRKLFSILLVMGSSILCCRTFFIVISNEMRYFLFEVVYGLTIK